MVATPVTGVNLAFWNILPMGASTYGGDLQVYDIPNSIMEPFTSFLNPIAELQLATRQYAADPIFGCGGGGGINMGAAQNLAATWLNPINQEYAGVQYNQANQGITATKNKLNALLLNESATPEDREKVNEHLAEIDKLEKELKELQNATGVSTQEVYDKSFEIEQKLRKIATEVGNLSSKITQAAQQAAQQAQQAQQQAQAEQQTNNNATVAVENADPEAERRSQT